MSKIELLAEDYELKVLNIGLQGLHPGALGLVFGSVRVKDALGDIFEAFLVWTGKGQIKLAWAGAQENGFLVGPGNSWLLKPVIVDKEKTGAQELRQGEQLRLMSESGKEKAPTQAAIEALGVRLEELTAWALTQEFWETAETIKDAYRLMPEEVASCGVALHVSEYMVQSPIQDKAKQLEQLIEQTKLGPILKHHVKAWRVWAIGCLGQYEQERTRQQADKARTQGRKIG